MQSNFTSYVRVSSCVSFVASIDEITINSSEIHIDRFPSFFYVNYQLMFYSVYSNSCCFFKNFSRASYCTCSSGGSAIARSFSVVGETRKNLNVLSCIHVLDLVLKYSNIKKDNCLHYSPNSLCWCW